MADRRATELRRLLRQRAGSATDEALRSGGQVSPDEIQAVERLRRLIELEDAVQAPRRAWPVAIVLAVTLLVISLLLFARVGETEVELEIDATEVGFSLPTREALFRDIRLEALGVSGLRRIDLPEALAADFPTRPVEGGADQAIRVATAGEGSRRGAISIGAIAPAADTDVWLRRADLPRQYRLSLRSPGLALKVDLFGPVVVSIAGRGRRQIDVASPQAILLEPAPAPSVTALDMTFPDGEARGTVAQVPVRALGFFRVAELDDQGVSIVRSLSTIASGTLYFESLNGVSRQLRAGEALRFRDVEGEIRTLRLQDEALSVNFQGTVRGMQTGSRENARSLMPTWLEWLRARHGLSLLWGSTLYVFGVIMAVLRWFGTT